MDIAKKVWENSLQTCEYIGGYENSTSTLTVKCIKHNNIFETKYENVRRDNRAHLLCPICQSEARLSQHASSNTILTCAYCNKEFSRNNSKLNNSRSGLYFCCREHKDLAARLNAGKDFDVIRPDHYGDITLNYRLTAFRRYEHKCSVCGWAEDEDILEVHHIDENREHNEADNLIILCPICHRKLTSHKYILLDRQTIIQNN